MLKHIQGEHKKMFTYRRLKNQFSSPAICHDITTEHQTNWETNHGDKR
jgi:hypothetical protein